MAGNDNYCLRLNGFEENAKLYWQELQMEKDFYDVTLACEDKQIKIHKLVISSCSPVLGNILKLNQTPHPVIYLRRVKYRDLQNLVNFMYQGEANVAEQDLPSFLEIAEDLKIRGLCEKNTEASKSNGVDTSQVVNQKLNPSTKRNKIENDSVQNINDSNPVGHILFNSDIDTKTMIAQKEVLNETFNQECVENNKTSIISTLGIQDAGGIYPCGQCVYKAKRLTNLSKHIKSIHEGERHPCAQCDYKATEKSKLVQHVRSIHEGVRYPCDKCDYKATFTGNLRKHQLKFHN